MPNMCVQLVNKLVVRSVSSGVLFSTEPHTTPRYMRMAVCNHTSTHLVSPRITSLFSTPLFRKIPLLFKSFTHNPQYLLLPTER